jgi:CRP/FNR family transcriptional regulator, cyclic AMP receptor protein
MRKVLFILGQLNDSDVEWLSTAGERQKIAAGTELIPEGAEIDAVYIILDGQMSVWAGGGRVKLGTVASGDILGEISLVDSSKTLASIVCDTESSVLAISKSKLTQRLAADVGFAARFYKALALFLASRMRRNTRQMGYGKVEEEPSRGQRDVDELDEAVLDNVHLAGARFERILQKLARS